MHRVFSSSGDVCPDRGHQPDGLQSATPKSNERERVRSLPILVEHQDGWHLDWVEVVETYARRSKHLTASAQHDLVGVGQ